MLLQIGQHVFRHDAGRHVLIGQPLIGEHRRGQLPLQIHMGKPLIIQLCQLLVALPQGFRLRQRKALHSMHQLPGLFQVYRQAQRCQRISIYPHFLGR